MSRSSSMLSRISYNRLCAFVIRSGSTSSKGPSFTQSKSADKGKADAKYLAADYFSYTTFSYYDVEAAMTKFRLPQPSSSKPEPIAQKK